MQPKRLKQLQDETKFTYERIDMRKPSLWMHSIEKDQSKSIVLSYVVLILFLVLAGLILLTL